MYKAVPADKDAYITNKIVRSVPAVSANVGSAGTLDLFKIYGMDPSESAKEYSRILVHFDLSEIKKDYSEGKLDIADDNFWCKMHLRDVYGGQTTPANFTVEVFPLSASFNEGYGKDVAYFSDKDVCNWLSSSVGTPWYVTGCGAATVPNVQGDYITSSAYVPSFAVQQYFATGEEDLVVDVTKIISATISQELPDAGLRISLSTNEENNDLTYFVKRFASRHAYDESKRPRLVYGYNDFVWSDVSYLELDVSCSLNVYNSVRSEQRNFASGGIDVVGNNSLLLRIDSMHTSGTYTAFFTGSQLAVGSAYVSGAYTADLFIDSTNPIVASAVEKSGSLTIKPSWTSLNGLQTYRTTDALRVYPPRASYSQEQIRRTVSVTNIEQAYTQGSEFVARLNVFDQSDPLIQVYKVPVELPGIVARNTFYSIRDAVTNEVIVPFETQKKSTVVSADGAGMFFKASTSMLVKGRTYVIDIMFVNANESRVYKDASPTFRIE